MSRNQNGVYFLPDGNPVAPGELIKSDWANKTLDDVANALTDSLDREGLGGMNGPLRLTDGLVSRPGLSFVNEPKMGLFREGSNIMAVAVNEQKVTEFNANGMKIANGKSLFLGSNPVYNLEAATKQYVDNLATQVTELIGTFGVSKKPADLPPDGRLPANWDSPGSPKYPTQMSYGQCLLYTPTEECWLFCGTNFTPSGWTNIGKVQGPQGLPGPAGSVGPPGAQGPIGPEGPSGATGQSGPMGPQGVAGPKGDVGPAGQKGDIGPQGPRGIQGETGADGPIGPEGPAGKATEIVGSFGASKTPLDLPPNGFLPKDWDSPGNPSADEQLSIGQALVYTACPKGTLNYGHVYSYVGTQFATGGWVDAGDIVGPAGPTGPAGPQGVVGPTGPQGPQGDTGAKGDTGAQGIQGIQGAQGPAGTNGSDGPQGPKGDTGATGKDGDAGPKGDPGPPNSLSIGTVVAGTTPAAFITGSAPNQVLSLVLQTGPQGPQGPKGDPGTTGVSSFNGRTGSVSLINSDVTGALGYTPYNSTNPSGYASLADVAKQGYTTQTWVQQQGYATQAFVTGKGYTTLAEVASQGYAKTNAVQTWSAKQTFTGTIFSQSYNFATTTSIYFSDNKLQFAINSNPQMTIAGDGTFLVKGGAYKPGGGAWADSSDSRIKADITPLQGALSKLMQLRPVDYELLTSDASGQTAGFIAQEVREVFPDAVSEREPDEAEQNFIPKGENILCIGWKNDFFAYIVGAIQDLSRQNEALQTEIEVLKGAKK